MQLLWDVGVFACLEITDAIYTGRYEIDVQWQKLFSYCCNFILEYYK